MGLHWVTSFCATAKYVMKMDDDVNVDFYQLHYIIMESRKNSSRTIGPRNKTNSATTQKQQTPAPFLPSKVGTVKDLIRALQEREKLGVDGKLEKSRFILGRKLNRARINRDNKFKWYITAEQHPEPFLPNYVHGPFYMTTIRSIPGLLNQVQNIRFIWIDDPHVTGSLREAAGIDLIDASPLFTMHDRYVKCCSQAMNHHNQVRRQCYSHHNVGLS